MEDEQCSQYCINHNAVSVQCKMITCNFFSNTYLHICLDLYLESQLNHASNVEKSGDRRCKLTWLTVHL